jgi:ABC-2 type transport system ATP-binding protein
MSEADELSQQIAIIDKGQIVASGTPTDIKRRFSRIGVLEVILRQARVKAAEDLSSVSGVRRVTSTTDGPIQKLTIHTAAGADIKDDVRRVLGESNVESIVTRDPTLEEAYISIFK